MGNAGLVLLPEAFYCLKLNASGEHESVGKDGKMGKKQESEQRL